MATTHPDPSMLGPWTGLGITALYALAALIGGAVVLKRRDA
jgi:ABC-2 type transport system permease protein